MHYTMPVSVSKSIARQYSDACPMVPPLHFLGQKWMLPLLVELFSSSRPQRFADLQRALYPITPKMLSARLKELVRKKFVRRKKSSNWELDAVSYAATSNAEPLRSIVTEVRKWCAHSVSFQKTCRNCASYQKCRLAFS